MDEVGENSPTAPAAPPGEEIPVNRENQQVTKGNTRMEPERRLTFPIRFTGSASEYFRIWIVNTVLSIITLGIYAAWAKVRKRQYLYINTRIDDQGFHYLASPIALLKGNLIVAAMIILYWLLSLYAPIHSGFVILFIYLLMPILVVKSIRFNLRNTEYRNIRFKFHGSIREAYWVYLIIPLVMILTLGLMIPYALFRQKEYYFSNLGYGKSRVKFMGESGRFFQVYYLAGFLVLVSIAATITILVAVFFRLPIIRASLRTYQQTGDPAVLMNKGWLIILFYVVVFIVPVLLQQYVFSRIFNYCWAQSTIDKADFKSTLRAFPLMWIRLTNILAIMVTLGLALPWARVRRLRYICDQFSVSAESLDQFEGEAFPEESAVAESASDFLNFEFGF